MDMIQRVDEKDGLICLVIMFSLGVLAMKMSQKVLFYFLFFLFVCLFVFVSLPLFRLLLLAKRCAGVELRFFMYLPYNFVFLDNFCKPMEL